MLVAARSQVLNSFSNVPWDDFVRAKGFLSEQEVNLARAYVRSGALGEAERVLRESLERSPKGPHSGLVQQHLDVISSE